MYKACLLRLCRGLYFWVSDSTAVSSGGLLCRPTRLLVVDKSGAATSASTQLPGTFLGLDLDLGSDRLYDLVDDIPDVMGLRALCPSAGICKVMSMPLCPGGDSRRSHEHCVP